MNRIPELCEQPCDWIIKHPRDNRGFCGWITCPYGRRHEKPISAIEVKLKITIATPKGTVGRKGRAVIRIDDEGREKPYDTIVAAAKENNTCTSLIAACLEGTREKAAGYRWKPAAK